MLMRWVAIGIERLLLRSFSSVKYLNEIKVNEHKSTLLLMNHVSFHDGAITQRFCRRILRKKFKVMVLEQQMRTFKFLKYVGCFSINRKSRDVLDSISYAAELLNDPHNAVVIFPQGELYSMHLNRIHFENGLTHVLNKTTQPFQVIFAVFLIDYLDNVKPMARVYLHEYTGSHTHGDLQDNYNKFYNECKLKNRNLHRPPAWVTE